jgi:hypothetical protein
MAKWALLSLLFGLLVFGFTNDTLYGQQSAASGQQSAADWMSTTGVGAGWQFEKAILAIQPMMHYSGKTQKGLYKYWDSSETNPPTNLTIDNNWDLADTPASIRSRMFNREDFFLKFLKRGGATYYRTFVLKGVRKNGGDALVHQFWYYFPTGEGSYFGVADQGFALVEMEQSIPANEYEKKSFEKLVRQDLKGHQAKLEKLLKGAKDKNKKAAFSKMKENIANILARPVVEVPINYYIERLYTTSVMYPNQTKPIKVNTYKREEVTWLKTRPKIYVAQGTHNLVADRKDFQSGDHCDAPYILHPNLRESIINTHNPYERANPFPGGTNPHKLDFKGTFVEHPIYWLGARRYLEKLAAGEKLKAVEVRWTDGK